MDNKKRSTKKDSTKSPAKENKVEKVIKYNALQACIVFKLSSISRIVLLTKYESDFYTQERWESILIKENLNFKKT